MIVSMIFSWRLSVAEDVDGLVIGERMMYVHPSVDLGTDVVSTKMSWDRSAIWLSPKPSELV